MVVELAQDELTNLCKVWLSIFISLSYCHFIGKITSKGFIRLTAIFPVIILFFILPLHITSIHFCGFTSFFISWLANFKLLLFAFGKPPLSCNLPISFPLFLAVSCLPIKIQPSQIKNQENGKNPDHKSQNNSYPHLKNSQKSKIEQIPDQNTQNNQHPLSQIQQKTPSSNYPIKGVLLILMIKIYDYSDEITNIHPKLLWLIYFFHIYFGLELSLAILAKLANIFMSLELEPQFNEPLLSTSLQDFWGKRWNLMVTSIMRPTVYLPTLDYSTKVLGRKTASFVAVMATFIVSGVMHELIFYYLGRVGPTFEVTWFFLLHGVCLCFEISVKKCGRERGWWVPPRWLSGFLTASFVVGSGFWLFLPPLLEAGLDTRGLEEYAVVVAFVRRVLVY